MDGGGEDGYYESSEHGNGERQFHDEVVRLVASIGCLVELVEEGQEDGFQWQPTTYLLYDLAVDINRKRSHKAGLSRRKDGLPSETRRFTQNMYPTLTLA